MVRHRLISAANCFRTILIVWLALFYSATNRLYFALFSFTCIACFIIGYCLGVPDIKEIGDLDIAKTMLLGRTEKQSHSISEERHEELKLDISDKVDSAIKNFVEQLLQDLVDVWFVPLCKSGESEFQACVKSTIFLAVKQSYEIIRSAGKDKWILLVYGLINALLVHYKEFKDFEQSPLMFENLSIQKERRRTYHASFTTELEHLRKMSILLLKKLLPKQEGRSILVGSLLKELIASGALFSIVEKISDPDFVNTQIVEAFALDTQLKSAPFFTISVLRGENLPTVGKKFLELHIDGQLITKLAISKDSMSWKCSFKCAATFRSVLALRITSSEVENEDDEIESVGSYVFSSCYFDKVLQINLGTSSILFKVSYSEPEASSKRSSYLPTTKNPAQRSHNIISEKYCEHDFIDLEAAMQNNELFMEFMDYLSVIKAPPYLHFLMNVDALRQYTSLSLNIEPDSSEPIANHFRGTQLSSPQIELLSLIKSDAADVFANHFSDKAKYHIPLSAEIVSKIQVCLDESNLVNGDSMFTGGLVGPDIFKPAYIWVLNLLDEVYFPKFKETEGFARFLEFAEQKTLSFKVCNQASCVGSTQDRNHADSNNECDSSKQNSIFKEHIIARLTSASLDVLVCDLHEGQYWDHNKSYKINFRDEGGLILSIHKKSLDFIALHRRVFGTSCTFPDPFVCEEFNSYIQTLISRAVPENSSALLDFIDDRGTNFYMMKSTSCQNLQENSYEGCNLLKCRSSSKINLSDEENRIGSEYSAEKPIVLAHFHHFNRLSTTAKQNSNSFLSEDDVDFVIESLFSLIVEVFDLKDPNQWFRRKLLSVFKQVLKQAYGESLSSVAEKKAKGFLSEDFWAPQFIHLSNILYPEGVFIAKRRPPPPRNEDQKFMTMMEAKALLLDNLPDLFVHLMGRYTVICGVGKLFNSFQNRAFNKALIFSCIDILLKILLSESDG